MDATRERRVAPDAVPKKKVRGVARSVDVRVDQNNNRTLTFRVDRYDHAGNRLTPVGVEMHHQRGGIVTDGDEVEVKGRWSRGTLRASRIVNLSTSSEVRTWFPRWLKWVALVVFVLGAAIAALLLTGVFTGRSGAMVNIPDVTGQEEAAAFLTLSDEDLSPVTSTESSDSIPAGRVIRTDPPANFPVARGSSVTVVVSSGGGGGGDVAEAPGPQADTVSVPNVIGEEQAAAVAELRDVGLSPETTTEDSEDVPLGHVISTDPGPESDVEFGTTVTVVVSSGPTAPETVDIPAVAGDYEEDATARLQDLGLTVEVVGEVSDAVPEGVVIGSDPSEGSSVPAGSTVTLIVSAGPGEAPPEA